MRYFTKLCTVGLVLMLGLSFLAKGQGYESIFGDSLTVWKSHYIGNYEGPGIGYNDSIYCSQNDTFIKGNNYKIMYSASAKVFSHGKTNIAGFLREDTVDGKLWYRTVKDTAEKLIFNLSLKEHDSFYVAGTDMQGRYEAPPGFQSVDAVYLNKNNKKVVTFNLSSPDCSVPLKFVEGHGPTFGFNYKSNVYLEEKHCEVLLCHLKNPKDQFPYKFYNTVASCPSTHVTGIEDFALTSQKIKIYPNPIKNIINIKTVTNKKRWLEITFYSMKGKKINTYHITNRTSEISTKGLNSGLYLYRISNQNNEIIKTGKLIKQ